MSSLGTKSLTELRGIAQGLGVEDIFKKDRAHLLQAIDLKTSTYVERVDTAPNIHYIKHDENAVIPVTDIEEALASHINRGLKFMTTDKHWHMTFGNREDSGTLSMPIKHIIACANGVMV